MKTIACLTVSTAQQDAGSQRHAILEHAREHDFQIDDFVEATARGQATANHRRLDEPIGILNLSDRLVVSELSRLGRSLGQIVTVLDSFATAGVAFIAIKENIRVEGKQDIQTKVMTTLFALFAEVERDLISEHTREGLAKTRESARSSDARKDHLVYRAWTARKTKFASSLTSAFPRAQSPGSPVFPGKPSITSFEQEALRPVLDVHFCTKCVGTLTCSGQGGVVPLVDARLSARAGPQPVQIGAIWTPGAIGTPGQKILESMIVEIKGVKNLKQPMQEHCEAFWKMLGQARLSMCSSS